MITLTLPFPPTVNTYWRHVPMRGGVRSLISKRGREYRTAVAEQVVVQRASHALSGRLSVEVVAHPPDRRKRDIDNLSKSLLDALGAAGVYGDDGQIDRLVLTRGDVERGGRVAVTISEVA